MSAIDDLGYKFLFAHPEMVRELVVGFTPFSSLSSIDAAAFERVNSAYVSERFSERQDDIVWRVPLGDEWLYVYILLECQSGVDRWMALRMQVYIGLLYQDLVKRGETASGARLPPVLPLVFYNGAAPWTASGELGALIVPGPDGLAQYQARQRYFLIDQQRLDASVLAHNRGVLAMLFRLELWDDYSIVGEAMSMLVTWLGNQAQTPLRRSVMAWAEQLIQRKTKGRLQLHAVAAAEDKTMTTRRFDTWMEAFTEQGREEGLQKGIEQGMKQGIEQGIEQGGAILRRALTSLLSKQDGALPTGAAVQIAGAPLEQVGQWFERALAGASASELFAAPPQAEPGGANPACPT